MIGWLSGDIAGGAGCGRRHGAVARLVRGAQGRGVRYVSTDVSAYACERYGHEQRDIARLAGAGALRSPVCQGVLQYLADEDAAQGDRGTWRRCAGASSSWRWSRLAICAEACDNGAHRRRGARGRAPGTARGSGHHFTMLGCGLHYRKGRAARLLRAGAGGALRRRGRGSGAARACAPPARKEGCACRGRSRRRLVSCARDWEAAVGSRIAARARPIRIDRGMIVGRTATATWAQELALLADAILHQLRGRGVAVEALRFRASATSTRPSGPPTRSRCARGAPGEVPLPATVAAVVQGVADPGAARRDRARGGPESGLVRVPRGGRHARKHAGEHAREPARSPQAPATSAPSAARGPRSAGTGRRPQGRTVMPSPPARRGKH